MHKQRFFMRITQYITAILLFFIWSGCAKPIIQDGHASYYAGKFLGRKTANGETFKKNKLTAAHKTLPFGTKVKVKNLRNGKTVKVKINDRGPFVKGRDIDLSWKAAKKLGMIKDGVVPVELSYKIKK